MSKRDSTFSVNRSSFLTNRSRRQNQNKNKFSLSTYNFDYTKRWGDQLCIRWYIDPYRWYLQFNTYTVELTNVTRTCENLSVQPSNAYMSKVYLIIKCKMSEKYSCNGNSVDYMSSSECGQTKLGTIIFPKTHNIYLRHSKILCIAVSLYYACYYISIQYINTASRQQITLHYKNIKFRMQYTLNIIYLTTI